MLGLLKAQAQAAPSLMADAFSELMGLISPRAVSICVRDLLTGAIETPEDLETAPSTIREAVERALADGTPVVLE